MNTQETFSGRIRQISTFISEYLSYLQEKKSRSAMTLESYEKDLSQFLDFLSQREDSQADMAPDERIATLTSPMAQQFVDYLMGRSFSVSTIGRKVTAIRGFYKYLLTTGRMDANPFEHTYVPQRHAAQIEYLQPEQLRQLFESINCDRWLGWRDRAIVALLYNTGMRVSDLLSLVPEDLNMENQTVTIHTGGQKSRVCQLQGWVTEAVRTYLERRKHREMSEPLKTDRVFINRDGGPLTARSIRRKLKHYSHEANLPIEASPAILRHSCAMHLLADGADAKTVRTQLGHLSASSMRPYLDCLQKQNAPTEPAPQQLAGV